MKVAIVTMQFPSKSETFASNDVLELLKQNIAVEVYCLRTKASFHEKYIAERGLENVPIHVIDIWSIVKGFFYMILKPKEVFFCLNNIVSNYSSIFRLDTYKQLFLVPMILLQYQRITDKKYDVVHLFWGHYPSLIGLLLKRFGSSCRVSMFMGAYDLERLINSSIKLLNCADIITTHSEGNARKLAQYTNVDIEVIYRGVNQDEIENIKLSSKPLSNKNNLKVVSAGRLIKDKGFDDVLHAFKIISENIRNSRLVILGDGPERANLEKLAKDLRIFNKVEFLGHVSHHDVLLTLWEADLFLFMSKYAGERLPNVVKEAMALETVCITTKTTDIEELIENNVDGYLVDFGDYELASKYAINVFEENDFSIDLVKSKALKKIKSYFSTKASINKTINLWNN